jgi:hypothetical protein
MIRQRLNKLEKVLNKTTKNFKLLYFGEKPTPEDLADKDLELIELDENLSNKVKSKLRGIT